MPPKLAPAKAAPAKATPAPAKAPPAKAGPAGKAAASAAKPAAPAKAGAKPAAAKAKTTGAGPAAPVAPPTAEDLAASAAAEEVRRSAQAAMDAALESELESLRIAAIAGERRAAEKEAKAIADERARVAAEAKRKKEFLEACYDGDDAAVSRLLDAGLEVDSCDGHGNTGLSEAAAGGQETTVRLLLARGAEPNSRGEFERTPLWRACFLGHAEPVTPLLEAGADPRCASQLGETCVHVGGKPEIKAILSAWDLERTDALLLDLTAKTAAKAEAKKEAAAAAAAKETAAAADAEGASKRATAALVAAHADLERRISEHDTCVSELKGEDLIATTLSLIKDAEAALGVAREAATAAVEAFQMAKAAIRDRERAAAGAPEGGDLPGEMVKLRDLDDVLVRDTGDRIKKTGKWPLLIDTSGQASVFLRYLDTNYVNGLSPAAVASEKLRKSLLGALRYGKPLVLDTGEIDLFDQMSACFDQIEKGLLDALLSKELLLKGVYESLIRKSDGEEYEPGNFQQARIEANFKFVWLVTTRVPRDDLLDKMHALRVSIKK